MNVSELLSALHRESQRRKYIQRIEILDQSASQLKARVYISANLFVQVYRNDRFDTINTFCSLKIFGKSRIVW